jgi:transposase-like protein
LISPGTFDFLVDALFGGALRGLSSLQQRFSQRKGSALYRCKLPQDKAVAVLYHLLEDCGVRQTSRLLGVNKNTVVRLARVAGPHARQVHDELVALSPPNTRSPVR